MQLGRKKIAGRFDAKTAQFISNDKEYHIDFFQGDVARIYKAGYVGLMNKQGQILAEPKYDQIYEYQGNLAKINIHKRNGLINRKVEVVLEPFEGSIENFENGFAKCKVDYYDSRIINDKGEFINEHIYDFIGSLYDGHFPFVRQGKMGLLSTNGEEVIIINDYDDKTYLRIVNYAHYGASIILERKEISPLFKFENERALTFAKVGEVIKFGCINTQGKVVVPIEYDRIAFFKDGVAAAKKGGSWGVIDQFGMIVIPFEYESITVANQNRFIIRDGDEYSIIDRAEKKITNTNYSSISACPNGQFIVSKNERFGCLNADGNVQLKLKYPILTHLFGDVLITHNHKKWGAVTTSGKTVLPFSYDGIGRISDSEGTASRYQSSYSLNTGIPRFSYSGLCYSFDENGLTSRKGIPFNRVIEGRSDFYSKDLVIRSGPSTFAPNIVGNLPLAKADNKDSLEVFYTLPSGLKIVRKVEDRAKIEDNISLPVLGMGPITSYKYGVINEKNEFIIPMIYDQLSPNRAGGTTYFGIDASAPSNLLVAKKDQLSGVINLKNDVVIPIEYSHVGLFPSFIYLMNNKLEEVEDRWGDVYIEEEYSSGIVDLKGKAITALSPVSYGNEVLEEWFDDSTRQPTDH